MDGADLLNPIAAAFAQTVHAAGLMIRAPDGRVLFLKRAGLGDHASEWCFPGGKIEAGEEPLETAVRETEEEVGRAPKGKPEMLARFIRDGVDFTTFLLNVKDAFPATLNEEHTAWAWAMPDAPPEPLHPGVRLALAMVNANELDIARMMATDGLASPQRYKNVALQDMRITGTGAAYRAANKETGAEEEFVWRDPSVCCTEDFLARCNGLPVIFEHPKKALLDSKEYNRRVVGSVFLPYIKGQEVWGIVKIWDKETAELAANVQLSTSPGILLYRDNLDAKIVMEDGRSLLIEGKPSLIDHLAICAQGVWDKAAEPSGVRLDSEQGASVEGEDTQTGEVETMDTLRARMDAMAAQIEALTAARADSAEDDKAEEKEAAKADEADESDEAKMDTADEDKDEAKADEAKEEDAPEKKADAVDLTPIHNTIRDLDRRIPKALSEADLNALASAQERADAVASAFGERASSPMAGETPLAYRRRVVGKFRDHSATWKDVDLSKLDATTFAIAEKAIYDDAETAAKSGLTVPAGTLREVVKTDATGRRFSEFRGDPAAWMDEHKHIPQFGLKGERAFINTNFDR